MQGSMGDAVAKEMVQALQACVRTRDSAAGSRAASGEDLDEIVVCLGPGRCLFPTFGAESRQCAFCVRYPTARDTSDDDAIERFVVRVRKGH